MGYGQLRRDARPPEIYVLAFEEMMDSLFEDVGSLLEEPGFGLKIWGGVACNRRVPSEGMMTTFSRNGI